MEEVVNFYKALPKGNVAVKKGPFTNPGNGKPIVWTMGALFLIGYTIDYQMHLSEYPSSRNINDKQKLIALSSNLTEHHKNRAH